MPDNGKITWANERRKLSELIPWPDEFSECVTCGTPKTTPKQRCAPRCHTCENKRRAVNIVYYACPICGEPKNGRGRSDRILCRTCAARARWRSAEHRRKIHEAAELRFGAEIPWRYINFTDEVKELVRDRDNRKCLICGIPENGHKLDVHHIDYDKGNSTAENLVALCHSCHMRTNNNREYWKGIFSEAIP